MALLRAGSRRHRIVRSGQDYELQWTVDWKYGRVLYPRVFRRYTDEAGARKFARKWGVEVPT